MLVSGLGSFLATWESKAEARSIRPAETGATAMTATDSYAAQVAVKVVKATQGTMSLIGRLGIYRWSTELALASRLSHGFRRSRREARFRRAGCVSWRRA